MHVDRKRGDCNLKFLGRRESLGTIQRVIKSLSGSLGGDLLGGGLASSLLGGGLLGGGLAGGLGSLLGGLLGGDLLCGSGTCAG